MVDAKYRFVWGSCGFPGNSHDSIIFQSTEMWEKLQNNYTADVCVNVGGMMLSPMILGDSAFPIRNWLLKPYTSAILSPKQRYFNYRLSRARMVIEGAYGQLKGQFRVLLRKCESSPDEVKSITLPCCITYVLIEMKVTLVSP